MQQRRAHPHSLQRSTGLWPILAEIQCQTHMDSTAQTNVTTDGVVLRSDAICGIDGTNVPEMKAGEGSYQTNKCE